ncbi:MAG: hypothetical protein WCT04_16675 [Planctomycetota bacterium]
MIARLHVTLRDAVKKKEYPLNGAYLGDAAGNLRLRVTTESGQLLLDMGMRGENVTLCLPGKSRHLTGTREELLNQPNCHLALLAQCGRALDLFFPVAPPSAQLCRTSCCVDNQAFCNVPETSAPLPRYLTRLTVDLSTRVVEQKNVFARGGVDAGRIVYSRYRFPEADATPSKPAYPGRVTLHVPGGAYSLELDVEDLSLNTPIAPAKFTVPVPDGFKRETLTAALETSLNIWEQ